MSSEDRACVEMAAFTPFLISRLASFCEEKGSTVSRSALAAKATKSLS